MWMQIVSIVSSDDEADNTPHPAAKKILTKTTCHPVQVKVKQRQKNLPTIVKKKCLNNNNVRVSDLPEFAEKSWRSQFLSTLYNNFFTSNQPFNNFTQNNDQFISLLQTVIAEVFPNIDYEITLVDSIHFLIHHLIFP